MKNNGTIRLPENDFWVECNVCKTQLKNWTGSTTCCGSIAFIVENGKTTKKMSLFTDSGAGIKPSVVEIQVK